MAAKAPSFAALVGAFRAEHDSEVQAAAALLIAPSTMSDYCDGLSLPTVNGVRRLAPLLGIPADELAQLVEAQRAAQARGESIATVAPVRTRARRLPVVILGADG
jgi:transcriptional regulator with XRE-family HTH domain